MVPVVQVKGADPAGNASLGNPLGVAALLPPSAGGPPH